MKRGIGFCSLFQGLKKTGRHIIMKKDCSLWIAEEWERKGAVGYGKNNGTWNSDF